MTDEGGEEGKGNLGDVEEEVKGNWAKLVICDLQ